jgi:hypothetical protein
VIGFGGLLKGWVVYLGVCGWDDNGRCGGGFGSFFWDRVITTEGLGVAADLT